MDTLVKDYVKGDTLRLKVSMQDGYYYLHRDYLGSIVAISDEQGKVIEKRHYGAWGALEKYESSDTALSPDRPLLDRGWTGHEYVAAVHLVHK